jgi:hypothetical protein
MELPLDAAAPRSGRRYVIWTVVFLVLTTALLILEAMAAGADTAEVIGVALFPSIVLGVVWVLVALRARWDTARPKILFWASAMLLLLHCSKVIGEPVARQKARAEALSSLKADGQWLRHAGLRFELPHPGAGFLLDSNVQAAADSTTQGRLLLWVFTHGSLPYSLTVMVADSVRRREHGFRRFVAGIRRAAQGPAGQLAEDTLEWNGEGGEYRARFLIGEERRALRCIAFKSESYQIRIVCANTASLEGDSLAFVREGLRQLAP